MTVAARPCADRHHADRGRNRARLHLRSALPRFSLRVTDHGGGAVRSPDAVEPAAGRRAADRRSRLRRPAGGRGALYRHQRGAGQLAVAVDLRDVSAAWRLRCGGRGPRKTQNKQADREPRQHDIVEHDAEPGGDQPAGHQHDRRPDHMQRRDDQRDDAEHRILEQRGRQHPRLAEHGVQPGVAGQRHGRKLDREIAQIKRVADGQETDDQQELHLVGRQAERDLFHRANMAGKASGQAGRRSRKPVRSSRKQLPPNIYCRLIAAEQRTRTSCLPAASAPLGERRRSGSAWHAVPALHGFCRHGGEAADGASSFMVGAGRQRPWSRSLGHSRSARRRFGGGGRVASGPATSRSCSRGRWLPSLMTMIGRSVDDRCIGPRLQKSAPQRAQPGDRIGAAEIDAEFGALQRGLRRAGSLGLRFVGGGRGRDHFGNRRRGDGAFAASPAPPVCWRRDRAAP